MQTTSTHLAAKCSNTRQTQRTEESSVHPVVDSAKVVFRAMPVTGDTTPYPLLGGEFTVTTIDVDDCPVVTLAVSVNVYVPVAKLGLMLNDDCVSDALSTIL